MRADVSVDCLSNSAELIAAGAGHLDVKSCPSSCLSANPSWPPLCDYCRCCLPEVPGGRQLSTLSLFVIVCNTQDLSFDCALIHIVGLLQFRCRKFPPAVEKVIVFCYCEFLAFKRTVFWSLKLPQETFNWL